MVLFKTIQLFEDIFNYLNGYLQLFEDIKWYKGIFNWIDDIFESFEANHLSLLFKNHLKISSKYNISTYPHIHNSFEDIDIFNSFEDIFKSFENIIKSFEDIFNSFEDIFKPFEHIFKYNIHNLIIHYIY